MKLIYIFHSGFVIEGKDYSILIDYYRDTPQQYVRQKFLKRSGKIYILASHAHPDHFNPEILSWRRERPDIQYIFSEDIRNNRQSFSDDVVFLKKGEVWSDETLKVEAFGSTDVGVSFLIHVENKTIFHAGDLNNWHWKAESTPEEVLEAENNYLHELDTLSQAVDEVDIAFFPVDPRLGEEYTKGACQFMEHIRTKLLVPMHFWEKYDKANAFQECAEKQKGHFFALHKPGDELEIK